MIASIIQPFCRGCSRARLSAEGKLYTCLFAGTGHDLRGPLRGGASDQALRRQVAGGSGPHVAGRAGAGSVASADEVVAVLAASSGLAAGLLDPASSRWV